MYPKSKHETFLASVCQNMKKKVIDGQTIKSLFIYEEKLFLQTEKSKHTSERVKECAIQPQPREHDS